MNDQDYIEGREVEYQEKRMGGRDEDYGYISNDLDSLSRTNALLDELEKERDNLIAKAIPSEVQTRIDVINDEYNERMMGPHIAASKLRELIKEDVLEHGSTVKGEHIMAVWNKGRESWDTKALKGYAAAHPDVLQLKKVGEPSVTIRKI